MALHAGLQEAVRDIAKQMRLPTGGAKRDVVTGILATLAAIDNKDGGAFDSVDEADVTQLTDGQNSAGGGGKSSAGGRQGQRGRGGRLQPPRGQAPAGGAEADTAPDPKADIEQLGAHLAKVRARNQMKHRTRWAPKPDQESVAQLPDTDGADADVAALPGADAAVDETLASNVDALEDADDVEIEPLDDILEGLGDDDDDLEGSDEGSEDFPALEDFDSGGAEAALGSSHGPEAALADRAESGGEVSSVGAISSNVPGRKAKRRSSGGVRSSPAATGDSLDDVDVSDQDEISAAASVDMDDVSIEATQKIEDMGFSDESEEEAMARLRRENDPEGDPDGLENPDGKLDAPRNVYAEYGLDPRDAAIALDESQARLEDNVNEQDAAAYFAHGESDDESAVYGSEFGSSNRFEDEGVAGSSGAAPDIAYDLDAASEDDPEAFAQQPLLQQGDIDSDQFTIHEMQDSEADGAAGENLLGQMPEDSRLRSKPGEEPDDEDVPSAGERNEQLPGASPTEFEDLAGVHESDSGMATGAALDNRCVCCPVKCVVTLLATQEDISRDRLN